MGTNFNSTAGRSTLLAAILFALSWLLPNHHEPWVDFYADAWAGLTLWCVAAVVLWRSRASCTLPWHTLPLLALACGGIVCVQYAAGLIETFGVAWISMLYLMGFMLALLVGAAWEHQRPGQSADFLFLAVLIGASGSLLIQLQQWLQINPGPVFWLLIPAPPSRFHANLGQANQLSSLMCLGVLACAWLHKRWHIPGWLAWSWAVLLAIGLALTESRTGWMVVLTALAALIVWRKRLGIGRPLMSAAFGWAGAFALCVVALPYVNLWLGRTTELGTLRGTSTLYLRLEFWSKLGEALLRQPWFGYGWMQTSFAQFTLDPYDMVTGGTLRHAHNLVLDLGVELGVPLGLTVSALLAVWIFKAARRVERFEHAWMLLFVAALGIHAMLEFPLHYAYFLLPFGLMAGALNVALKFTPIGRTYFWPGAVTLALAGAGLIVTAYDYIQIEEDFFALRFERQKLAGASNRLAPEVIALTQLRDMVWLARVDPAYSHSQKDIDRALQTTKLLPSLMAKYKLAAMYAFADQPTQAEYWVVVMTRMNRLNGDEIRGLHRQWAEQAQIYPPMAEISWPLSESTKNEAETETTRNTHLIDPHN